MVFTGLVETIGVVTALKEYDDTESGGKGVSLLISDCPDIVSDAGLGDSICVSGICLSITEFDKDSFKVGVAPETLRRTNLGSLKQGSKVNLERAVSASTRMGGHQVQGHVDTIATILSVTPDSNALIFRLKPRDAGCMRYIVEKGYICLDGVSLTVCDVNDKEGWFEIMMIALTQDKVIMGEKKAGDEVNVEVDLVGKLVEKSVSGYFESVLQENGEKGPAILEKMVSRLVEEKLKSLKTE